MQKAAVLRLIDFHQPASLLPSAAKNAWMISTFVIASNQTLPGQEQHQLTGTGCIEVEIQQHNRLKTLRCWSGRQRDRNNERKTEREREREREREHYVALFL